ncbi:MAG: hypothetical protein LBR39_00255, partial [Coriobacteriales bacterium]|nr:hypothetical protein [Coriobacteriales bacterium]
MKVSLKWLQKMVEVPADLAEFTNRLDLTGTAVEELRTSGASLEGIVVGQILTREAHSGADSLWVTTVDVGSNNLDEGGNPT